MHNVLFIAMPDEPQAISQMIDDILFFPSKMSRAYLSACLLVRQSV